MQLIVVPSCRYAGTQYITTPPRSYLEEPALLYGRAQVPTTTTAPARHIHPCHAAAPCHSLVRTRGTAAVAPSRASRYGKRAAIASSDAHPRWRRAGNRRIGCCWRSDRILIDIRRIAKQHAVICWLPSLTGPRRMASSGWLVAVANSMPAAAVRNSASMEICPQSVQDTAGSPPRQYPLHSHTQLGRVCSAIRAANRQR